LQVQEVDDADDQEAESNQEGVSWGESNGQDRLEGGNVEESNQRREEQSSLANQDGLGVPPATRVRSAANFPMSSSLIEGSNTSPLLEPIIENQEQNQDANDSFSVQNLRPQPLNEQESDQISQRERLQLGNAFMNS